MESVSLATVTERQIHRPGVDVCRCKEDRLVALNVSHLETAEARVSAIELSGKSIAPCRRQSHGSPNWFINVYGVLSYSRSDLFVL